MSLGERRRNSFFDDQSAPKGENVDDNNELDSRFRIEAREPPPESRQKQSIQKESQREKSNRNRRKTEFVPESVVETGWTPPRKVQKFSEDSSFAEELGPNRELQKKVRKQEETQFSQDDVVENDGDQWGSAPFYGDQEEFMNQKQKIPAKKEVTREAWEGLWTSEENVHEVEEEILGKRKSSGRQARNQENFDLQDDFSRSTSKKNNNLGKIDRKHDIFFQGKEPQEFRTVLSEVQEYISKNYSQLITENPEDSREQMKRYISKYILDNKVVVEGRNTEELQEELYVEMAEYGFLTKYVFGTGIEEIDINAWNDIEVQYSGGRTEKLTEHFDSPDHAINVIRRMLQSAGIVLDNSQPVVLGHLSKNIRIAVMKTPIVDEDVGVSASIRIVNPQSMEKKDFVNSGTATENMLDFLTTCVRYGVSICVAGATSSGKTTVLGWLLTTIPHFKRVYTIESGSRELDLVKHDENGQVCNSVIHTLTRDSDNDKQKVDQIALLDVALRFNPDVVVVGEMRGPEANAAQEAARTGVAVLTTIHANSARATYARMISLCKRAVDMGDETLYQYVTEAYSIVVFCKQLENGSRRMMEIMECVIDKDGTRVYRTLFQYIITENRLEDGKFIIEGSHKQVNSISQQLAKRFLENGMPVNQIKQWTEVSQ